MLIAFSNVEKIVKIARVYKTFKNVKIRTSMTSKNKSTNDSDFIFSYKINKSDRKINWSRDLNKMKRSYDIFQYTVWNLALQNQEIRSDVYKFIYVIYNDMSLIMLFDVIIINEFKVINILTKDVRLNDHLCDIVLMNFSKAFREQNWFADFDKQRMFRASRISFDHSSKTYRIVDDIDVYDIKLIEKKQKFYYDWYENIHCLMSKKEYDADKYRVRSSWKDSIKAREMMFKKNYFVMIKRSIDDVNDFTKSISKLASREQITTFTKLVVKKFVLKRFKKFFDKKDDFEFFFSDEFIESFDNDETRDLKKSLVKKSFIKTSSIKKSFIKTSFIKKFFIKTSFINKFFSKRSFINNSFFKVSFIKFLVVKKFFVQKSQIKSSISTNDENSNDTFSNDEISKSFENSLISSKTTKTIKKRAFEFDKLDSSMLSANTASDNANVNKRDRARR